MIYFTLSDLILNSNEIAKAIAKTPQSLEFDCFCTIGNWTGYLIKSYVGNNFSKNCF